MKNTLHSAEGWPRLHDALSSLRGYLRMLHVILTVLTICCASASWAAIYVNDSDGVLYQLNTADTSVTLVGTLPAGPNGYNEMAFDFATGEAWAQGRNGSFVIQQFDLADASAIGGPIGNGASMHGLEFVGGVLYVAGFAGTPYNGLATMDPSVGSASVSVIRDDWDADTGGDKMTGLAWDGTTMYGITNGQDSGQSSLYTIDLTDGSLSLVGPTGMRAGGLEFGEDGMLYAGGAAGQAGLLYTINTSTGTSNLVGDTGLSAGITGLMRTTSLPVVAPATPVPTLPLAALGLLGGLAGLLGLRRLRKAA